MTKQLILLASILALTHPVLALASTMSSEDYSIESGELSAPLDAAILNVEKKTELNAPPPQKNEMIQGVNFSYSTGFSKDANQPLSFSISQNTVDLGILSATNPVIRTNTLSINSPAGYQIFLSTNHPLEAVSGSLIPDTTCDNGSCSETTAAPWKTALTYGYGYRCDGIDCEVQFTQDDYFKQFPNERNNEKLQAIMKSDSVAKDKKGKVTYKVIISGTQAVGFYTNTLTYISIPNY